MFRAREIKRLLRFLHSEEGRVQIGYGVTGVTIATTMGFFLKETYLSDKYIGAFKLLRNRSSGQDVVASDSLLDLFTEEYNLADLVSSSSLTLRNFIPPKLFVTRDFETYSSGRNGAYMGFNFGLPVHFNFTSVAQILDQRQLFRDLMKRRYGLDQIRMENFQELSNSLLLSDRAKRFAIQYELQKQKQLTSPLIETLSVAMYTSAVYFLSVSTNSLFQLLKRPFRLRLLSYGGFFAICTLSFLQLRDDLYGWRGRTALRATLEQSDEYLDGAKEFLRKRFAANRSIAKMLPQKTADKYFTSVGDEKGTIMGFRELSPLKQLEVVEAWESLKEPVL